MIENVASIQHQITSDKEQKENFEFRAADGRVPGRRGRETRDRLLSATSELLKSTGYRDLRVVDIANEAGNSPATFYQYFPDVEAAVLVLGVQITKICNEELPALIRSSDWKNEPDEAAIKVVEGFLQLWSQYGAVLKVLESGSQEKSDPLRNLRNGLFDGPAEAFVEVADFNGSTQDSKAISGILVSMLVHVSNHQFGLEEWGVERKSLVKTLSRILKQSLVFD